ncbi:MAG: TlpA disulfide reductase family protein [Methylomonas sp.]|nr:TlpA disulfide reductase family protein [Methylomonas sp.]
MNKRIIIIFSALLALAPLRALQAAEVGKTAPACKLQAIDKPLQVDLQQFRGKVLYLDFWASWCPPCAESFPFMNRLRGELKESDFDIVTINMDQASEEAKDFLAKYPADFAVVADINEQCAKAFDVKAMPSSYLIDRNGVVRHVHLGFHAGDEQQIKAAVTQLLAER